MKRAVNIRLDEQIIYVLNQLTQELKTTKTEVIERAIELFRKENQIKKNNLLQFAGALKGVEADKMLTSIQESKNSKDFELGL
jgi:predicted transcriptional regulator